MDRLNGDFNTPFSATDKTSGHKIILDMEHLNSIINNLDLIDIFRTLQPTMAECILFSSAHGAWIMKDHMLNYKTSLRFAIELSYKSITKRHIELPPQIFRNLYITYHYTSE